MEKEKTIRFRATPSFKKMIDDHLTDLGIPKRKRSEFIRLAIMHEISKGAAHAIRAALNDKDPSR